MAYRLSCQSQTIPAPALLRRSILEQRGLDFLDQKGDIGTRETQLGCRDAVVLDVRQDVLMMRMGAGQFGICRVGLGVIPVHFVVVAPDFVAVTFNGQRAGIPAQTLVHNQPMSTGECEITCEFGKMTAASGDNQRRADNAGKAL